MFNFFCFKIILSYKVIIYLFFIKVGFKKRLVCSGWSLVSGPYPHFTITIYVCSVLFPSNYYPTILGVQIFVLKRHLFFNLV